MIFFPLNILFFIFFLSHVNNLSRSFAFIITFPLWLLQIIGTAIKYFKGAIIPSLWRAGTAIHDETELVCLFPSICIIYVMLSYSHVTVCEYFDRHCSRVFSKAKRLHYRQQTTMLNKRFAENIVERYCVVII